MDSKEKVAISEYLKYADKLFDAVKAKFNPVMSEKVAFVFNISDSYFLELKENVENLLLNTLKLNEVETDSSNLYQQLDKNLDNIINITSNGAILPKKENETEVNNIQRLIIDLFESHDGDALFEFGQCPFNLRVSKNNRLNDLTIHPFASTKYHTDVWAGEPIENINFLIPIYMEASYMNLEIMEASKATEFNTLVKATDYDSARPTVKLSDPYNLQLMPGTIGVLDPRAIHRTVFEPLNTIRVSIDFRFRLKLPGYLREIILDAFPGKHVYYVPYKIWRKVGRSKKYLLNESFLEFVDGINSQKKDLNNHRYNEAFSPQFADVV